MGCKRGEIEFAKQEAHHRFDEWVDVTGFIQRHTSYYYEMKSCITEAVDISFAVAFDQPIPAEGGAVENSVGVAGGRGTTSTRSDEIAAYIEDNLSDGDNSLYVSIERSTLKEAAQLLRAVR